MYASYYKTCVVPQCKSTTIKTPNKLFIYVPHDHQIRKEWLKQAKRDDAHTLSSDSKMYFCEDHFDLPNDMVNYMKYHIMGKVSQVRMKSGCLPTRFECQKDNMTPSYNSTEQSFDVNKQGMTINEECVKESEESSTPSYSLIEEISDTSSKKDEPTRRPSADRSTKARRENTELEKFKRRLIRVVARMLLQEKKNEDQLWAMLKKETGCDCKELWSRMRSLTIKKLNRLLEAQDRVDMLPAAARMSITDWLMFDTVMVHEDFDVIGMTETTKTDSLVLMRLFELVEDHKIEFLAGRRLADAWAAVTLDYNMDNRQCSPMLLQRRWYQLKLATRAQFYKFWSMYKGVQKKLPTALTYKPTPLQTEIAKRYKPLVVKPFMLWEDLVKNKLIVLPEEFERKAMRETESEGTPDVMCLEPVVETIDLDKESDSESECDKPENDIPPSVNIKQEPQDVDEIDDDDSLPYENRQEKILNFAEAVMEATTMELNEIDIAEHEIDINEPIDKAESNKRSEEQTNEIASIENTSSEDTIIAGYAKNRSNPAVDVEMLNEVSTVQDDSPAIGIVTQNNSAATSVEENCEIIEDDTDIRDLEGIKEPEIMLPQITSIFGGVDVSNETLSKISMLTAQITNSAKNTIIEPTQKDSSAIELSSDSIDYSDSVAGISEDASNEGVAVQKSVDDSVNNVKPDVTNWFGELSNDIDFADDGIQLVDDGIAYQDDDAYHTGDIKTEIEIEGTESSEDAASVGQSEDDPKVDMKLLMVPQVRTVKLDDMEILPVHLLQHVNNKILIDVISLKSRPLSMEPVSKTKNDATIKKVKLSSKMLQKPKSRTYNPIQLCKNPDFNTRLKRLSIGFFSSSRNCSLLKACKPLTIDVSKSFENRLANGTMYLEAAHDNDLNKKIDLTESSQNVSVVPSTMAVQSLIDINNPNINSVIHPTMPKNPVEQPVTSERSKIINLPDISEIRRINQKLLTAQVTPLQLKDSTFQPPVSINPPINTDNEKDNTFQTPVIPTNSINNINAPYTNFEGKRAGPASRTMLVPPKVLDTAKDKTIVVNPISNTTPPIEPPVPSSLKPKETVKSSDRIIPWKPRPAKPDIPWLTNSNSIYSPDTLLALDTLNKMLYLLTDDVTVKPTPKKRYKKYANALTGEDDDVLVVNETNLVRPNNKQSRGDESNAPAKDNDLEVINVTKASRSQKKQYRGRKSAVPPKAKKSNYCCWSSEKLQLLKIAEIRTIKHNCPYPLCLCCCRGALKEYITQQREMDEESIKKSEENRLAVEMIQESTTTESNKDICTDVAVIIPIVRETTETTSPGSPASVLDEESSSSSVQNEEVSARSVQNEEVSPPSVQNEESSLPSVPIGSSLPSVQNEESAQSSVQNEDSSVPSEQNEDSSLSRVQSEASMNKPTDSIAKNADVDSSDDSNVDDVEIVSETIVKKKVFRKKRSRITAMAVSDSEGTIHKVVETGNLKTKTVVSNSAMASITSSANALTTVAETTCMKTDMKPPPPPQRQRFRVKSSDGPKQKIPYKCIGEPKSKLRRLETQQDLLNNQKILLPPLSSKLYNQVNKVAIDSTKPSLVPKSSLNTKMIYLNSKQISEHPSENPIFLGKNKILLTTAKFPPNFKAFEAFQRNLRHTLALPKSITLKLQPNGRLTYIRCPKTKIPDELMATLPHLIEAIQQQIDSSVVAQGNTIQIPTTQTDNEVIDLIDDETPRVPENCDDSLKNNSNDSTKHIEKLASENDVQSLATEIQADKLEAAGGADNANNKNKDTQREQNNVTSETTTQTEKDDNITENETEVVQNVSTLQIKSNASSETTTEATVSDQPEKSDQPSTEVNESKSKDNSSSKTKNILSDLMAMSGIEPIDIAPTPQEALLEEHSKDATTTAIPPPGFSQDEAPVQFTSQEVPPLTPVSSSLVPVAPPNLVLQRITNPGIGQTPQDTNSQLPNAMLPHALTAITSLSELKYACSQNGMFFKLDLDTGLLGPINVCMKKFESAPTSRGLIGKAYKSKKPSRFDLEQSKSVIDLTDDDVAEVTEGQDPKERNSINTLNKTDEKTSEGGVHISGKKDKNTSGDSATVSGDNNKNTDRVNLPESPVKPLKLFKSGRSNVWARKLKALQKRISKTSPVQDVIRRQLKRKEASGASASAIDPNCSQLTEEKECSSDEEPLAKVAKKMRDIEKQDTVKDKNVSNSDVNKSRVDISATVSKNTVSHNLPMEEEIMDLDDGSDIPMEDDVVEPIECLEEHLDTDADDEDCILGV